MGEVGRLFLFMFQSSADFPGPWSLPVNRHHYSDLSPPLFRPFLSFLYTAVSASPESLNQSLPESQNQSHPTEDSLVSKGECLSLWESDLEGRINPTREESFHKTT